MAMRGEEAFNPGLMNNLICIFVTSPSTMKTTTKKFDRNFNAGGP